MRMIILVAAGLALTASVAAAAVEPRSIDGSDPAKWDRKLDGLVAAPATHMLHYESPTVRVYSVNTWRNGTEPFHLHPYFSVLVIDTPFAAPPGSGVNRDLAGKPIPALVLDTAPSPLVNILPPQGPHAIDNTGPVDGHMIRVDFKTAGHPSKITRTWGDGPMPISTDGSDPKTWRASQAGWNAARATDKILWRDDKVRVTSVTIPPGGQQADHVIPYPSVLVVDEAAAHVIRRQGQPDLSVPAAGPQVLLSPPEHSHSIRNIDRKPFHMIRVEFLQGFPAPARR